VNLLRYDLWQDKIRLDRTINIKNCGKKYTAMTPLQESTTQDPTPKPLN
jgi:hypothetical protein